MAVSSLMDVVRRWPEPPILPLAAEVERQLAEVLASLEQVASRDAVRSGRLWIECNSAVAPQVAGYVMKRLIFLTTCAHRLHVLYLVHDVLQTEAARKDSARPLLRAFKAYLPWILRPAYQLAQAASPAGEEGGRVLRLLHLWVERGILTPAEAEEARMIAASPSLPSAHSATLPLTPQPQSEQHWPTGAVLSVGAAGGPRSFAAQTHSMGLMARPTGGSFCAGTAGVVGENSYVAAHTARPQFFGGMRGAQPGAWQPSAVQVRTPCSYPEHLLARVDRSNLDSFPVGLMVTALCESGHARRGKRPHFVPYRPMNAALLPPSWSPASEAGSQLLERVEAFYRDLRDQELEAREPREPREPRDGESDSSRSSSRSRSRSRNRPEPPASMAAVPPPVM